MTLKIIPTTQFKKDVKRAHKRGFDLSILTNILDCLASEEALESRFRDHPLSGNYIGFRECHLKPDWLLIYAIDGDSLILTASRTGTHSDLFDE